MKHLKINDNKGFFLRKTVGEEPEWILIDQIGKDDLIQLLNSAITEDFIMDEYNEDILQNKAHQIIYKNINEKFKELIANKTRFKDESENLYRDALEKYSS
ncbi:hypothetical protein [Sphingobacterium sp. UME9]|uniref:hypothetical protein n=1 Tax=Sphingobacterium sp. UME9 TaxID=1862316 RepID=UPI00160324E1|nr:hypothetical protein [Sphingobacterium sp. UME9]MBB1646798.1 hypothetical protein [Sphingobacterium sp. UME9]